MNLQNDNSRLRFKLYYGEEKPVSACLRAKCLAASECLAASVAAAVPEPFWQGWKTRVMQSLVCNRVTPLPYLTLQWRYLRKSWMVGAAMWAVFGHWSLESDSDH